MGRPHQSLSSPDASASLDLGAGFLAALAAGLSALALGFLDLGSLPRFGFSGASLHHAPIWGERETDKMACMRIYLGHGLLDGCAGVVFFPLFHLGLYEEIVC